MQAFIVDVANRPGELALVADTIATREINVEAFGLSYGTTGAAAFLAPTSKASAARWRPAASPIARFRSSPSGSRTSQVR
jgi:hypothetical protein